MPQRIGEILVARGKITVTVHSLGAVNSPPSELALLDREGKILSSLSLPALKAPADLMPKTVTVAFPLPSGSKIDGASVVIDPNARIKEITRVNNRVKL